MERKIKVKKGDCEHMRQDERKHARERERSEIVSSSPGLLLLF